MNVAIGSMFRNSSYYLERYLKQILTLQKHLGSNHKVRVIAAEGDSTDCTYQNLLTIPFVDVVKCDHGGQHYGSIESHERFAQLSKIFNSILDAIDDKDEIFVYVESDLLWKAHDLGSCIDIAFRRDGEFDVISPLIFAGENFYDVWGFRGLDGSRFGPFKPYHSSLNGGITEVSSVGSCLATRVEVAKNCRIENDGALVGWCESVRNNGYRIGVDPRFRVNHP